MEGAEGEAVRPEAGRPTHKQTHDLSLSDLLSAFGVPAFFDGDPRKKCLLNNWLEVFK